MMQRLFLKYFLFIYTIYSSIYNYFLKFFGPIFIVYKLDDQIKNYTLWYYLGFNTKGKFFYKKITADEIIYSSLEGDLHQIKKNKTNKFKNKAEGSMSSANPFKRKNILPLIDDKPINFDLNILDNYVNNTPKKNVVDLKLFLKIFNKKCTHIQFIKMMPFEIVLKDIDQLSIYDLYDSN